MSRLREQQYYTAGWAVVLEGVFCDGPVSYVATWMPEDESQDHFPDSFRLSGPPSPLGVGVDPHTWRSDIGSQTATVVAEDGGAVEFLERAKEKFYFGDRAVWSMPSESNLLLNKARPGHYEYSVSAADPPWWGVFHSRTTTYRAADSVVGWTLTSSVPYRDAGDLVVWEGYPSLEGLRMLVVELRAGELVVDWTGWVESYDHSRAQNQIELKGVGPMRPLGKRIAKRRRAAVDAVQGSGGLYGGTFEVLDTEHIPEGTPPGHISVEVDDEVILPLMEDFTGALSGDFASRLPVLATAGDHGDVSDDQAPITYTYDRTGVLGGEHGPDSIDGVELVRRWLRFFLVDERTDDAGDTVYDGASWDELVDEDEFLAESDQAHDLDHFRVGQDIDIWELTAKAFVATGHFLRVTADGRLGVSRLRSLTPDELAKVFSTDPETPSQRVTIIGRRIDDEHPLRLKHATYAADLGGLGDVDPEEIEVQPKQGTGDMAPQYLGGEKRFDLSWWSRGRTGLVRDLLTDMFHLLRLSPIKNVIVPLEDFSDWEPDQRDDADPTYGRLPPVGEFVRLDGGPEGGIIGPGGKRVDFVDYDVLPVGLLLHTRIDRANRTATCAVLMLHWDEDDRMPKVVAPASGVTGYSDGGSVVETERAAVFADGDQVQLYDRSGRMISPVVYVVDETTGSDVTLDTPLTENDQKQIDEFADHRGVTLRLSDLEDYDNVFDDELEDYFVNSDNAKRKWAFWDVDPPDRWRV